MKKKLYNTFRKENQMELKEMIKVMQHYATHI